MKHPTPATATSLRDGIQLPSDRSFGLTMAGILLVVVAWLLWKRTPLGLQLAAAAGLLAAALAAMGWLAPQRLRPLNRAWMRLGALLNAVVSPLVLGLMFFGMITPMAIAMRLAGRDALRLKFDRAPVSYWVEREPAGPAGDSLGNQF